MILLSATTVKSVAQLLTLLVIFAFVLGITYFTTRYVANYQRGKMIDSNIKLMDAARLSQNKYIQIVQIGKKYYALAVCKDTVTVIAEVPEEEMIFNQDTGVVPQKFADILSNFKNKSSVIDENDDTTEISESDDKTK